MKRVILGGCDEVYPTVYIHFFHTVRLKGSPCASHEVVITQCYKRFLFPETVWSQQHLVAIRRTAAEHVNTWLDNNLLKNTELPSEIRFGLNWTGHLHITCSFTFLHPGCFFISTWNHDDTFLLKASFFTDFIWVTTGARYNTTNDFFHCASDSHQQINTVCVRDVLSRVDSDIKHLNLKTVPVNALFPPEEVVSIAGESFLPGAFNV